jgi:hypothetical protein
MLNDIGAEQDFRITSSSADHHCFRISILPVVCDFCGILQPFSLGFSLTNRPTNQGSKSFLVNNHLVHIFP